MLSDTHLTAPNAVLPTRVLEALRGVDLILHAGDCCRGEVLVALEQVAPVHAVHGNVDFPDLCRRLPDRLIVECEGLRIGLTHGHMGTAATTPERARKTFSDQHDLAAIVFGHSHQPWLEHHEGLLLFNPGSATRPREQPHPSLGFLTILDGRLEATHLMLRS